MPPEPVLLSKSLQAAALLPPVLIQSTLSCYRKVIQGNSLAVQWLGLRASTAGGLGSIPAQRTKIVLQAAQCGQKKGTQDLVHEKAKRRSRGENSRLQLRSQHPGTRVAHNKQGDLGQASLSTGFCLPRCPADGLGSQTLSLSPLQPRHSRVHWG